MTVQRANDVVLTASDDTLATQTRIHPNIQYIEYKIGDKTDLQTNRTHCNYSAYALVNSILSYFLKYSFHHILQGLLFQNIRLYYIHFSDKSPEKI